VIVVLLSNKHAVIVVRVEDVEKVVKIRPRRRNMRLHEEPLPVVPNHFLTSCTYGQQAWILAEWRKFSRWLHLERLCSYATMFPTRWKGTRRTTISTWNTENSQGGKRVGNTHRRTC